MNGQPKRVGDTPLGSAVRFVIPMGETVNEMRDWLKNSPEGRSLYAHGDCLLVWANEGDLFNQLLTERSPHD